jgi:hypothetical protein
LVFGGCRRRRGSLAAFQLSDFLDQRSSMSEQQAEVLEVAVREQAQRVEVDAVLREDLRVPLKAKTVEPARQRVHSFSFRGVSPHWSCAELTGPAAPHSSADDRAERYPAFGVESEHLELALAEGPGVVLVIAPGGVAAGYEQVWHSIGV